MAKDAKFLTSKVINIFKVLRTQSQLKNKFYSYLRSLILKTFKHDKIRKIFKIQTIESRILKRLYEGTNGIFSFYSEFSMYYGKISGYLEEINYELTCEGIYELIERNGDEIIEIYKLLFKMIQKRK